MKTMPLWQIPFSEEVDRSIIDRELRERIKELNCLYGVSKLAERHFDSINDLLEDLVNFLPHSWQYPEVACARIVFKGDTYKSDGFKLTKWRQSSRVYLYGEPVGEVAIFYLEECPPADEGPFLKEERALLDALADQIGTIAARISAELELLALNKQLNVERKALRESNIALRTVLTRIEEEKNEFRKYIKINIDKILLPILNALSLELSGTQSKYIEMLRINLEEITSPFISNLSNTHHSLTPMEINICNMIQSGLTTKEIARLRGISSATVSRHRENIRRKLKIANSGVNLATWLQSNMLEKI